MNNQLKEKNDKTKLALKKANNFISYRPRSTTEVENKLALMFDEDIVENVVNNLKNQRRPKRTKERTSSYSFFEY